MSKKNLLQRPAAATDLGEKSGWGRDVRAVLATHIFSKKVSGCLFAFVSKYKMFSKFTIKNKKLASNYAVISFL